MAPVDAVAIDGRIAEFIERVEAERTHLFLQHLHATVRRASPLLLGLAAMEGISIAAAVSQARPPESWPRTPLYDFPPNRLRVSQLRPIRRGSTNLHEERRFRRAFCDPGVIIRPVDDPLGGFAVRPFSGMLAFTAAIGPCLLSAFGTTATLTLREPLPETLAIAMPGRPLRKLIDHPLFTEYPCRVLRVDSDAQAGSSILSFRVPLVRFELPRFEGGLGAPAASRSVDNF
ncbi:hypothetical protein EQZ23_06885 [Sphingomonas sp. UV9]|uniref:hypothetical protein n=1 Tax=Sphingomonas sp. UV9 TaxID=1851410 RepID=UPI000FFC1267|nr:hypothetical protein [Sphingomonas sp. UV9]RXD04861.1 hypothetical protein EQZ23_06885 [Sphingomonas sp. UV9]